MESKTVNWKLSNRDTFFTCESLNSMLEKNITLDLQSLKVQAFMKDGNFSGEGVFKINAIAVTYEFLESYRSRIY